MYIVHEIVKYYSWFVYKYVQNKLLNSSDYKNTGGGAYNAISIRVRMRGLKSTIYPCYSTGYSGK